VAGLGEPRPQIVGVFIDESPEAVAAIADLVGLDRVQLHGSEPPGYPAPRPPIKALKVRDGVVPDAEGWPDPVLLDSWTADQRGGTGRAWDWDLARPLLAARQVIVAGGLNPGNVGRLVERYRPYGVDVSSGVESRPRVKDPALMRAFVAAVREADGR
jgi:phosphoribosylanthranilate isomerase